MTETKHEMARQLSAYYDGQLDEMSARAVGMHLADCPQCQETYRQFEAISALVADDDRRFEPPDSLAWNHFSRQLHDAPVGNTGPTVGARGRWLDAVRWQPLAAAAVFLVAIGLVAWWNWTGMGGLGPSTDLTTFVQRFVRDPEAAQMQLLAQFRGEPVQVTQVVRHLGIPLPENHTKAAPFHLASVYKLHMPCCDCVQVVCTRADGSRLAIFGHHCSGRVEVGEGKERSVHCDGKTCRLIELPESQYAVKFQVGNARLLVVGARDREEIEQLVAWLSRGT